MNSVTSNAPGLVVTHAVVFATGLVSTLIGLFSGNDLWLLVAGPCLVLSGLLIAVGSRITFAGPAGALLRGVLGPARVRVINLRAIVWVLVGLLICLWGYRRIQQRDEERPLQEPLAALQDVEAP